MDNTEFYNELHYQIAIQAAQTLLKNGSVSEDEYRQIDTILLKKYKPILSMLLSEKPLI